jgi:iron complex outermembrane receptor protein
MLIISGEFAGAQTDSVDIRTRVTEIKQVEVTGYRNQSVFTDESRVVTVIPGRELKKAGIQSLQDILEYVSNVDVRQRGAYGVQSDVTIRGGSFDHVMVLINGINVSDPQTGHASMDLPIDPEIIERIEVLEGSAARILGAGAFTGAINVVTSGDTATMVSASLFAGQYGFHRINLNALLNSNNFRHLLSVGEASSKGYMDDTDFKIRNGYYRMNYSHENTAIDFQAGIQDKKFGAAGFYSPRFPNQYEETGLWFASLRASTGNRVKISPSVYWRHRRDHYLLDRDNPSFYENFHLTDIMGSQFNVAWRMKKILNTVGVDIRSENIISNNLGFVRPDPIPVKGMDSAFYTKQYGRTNLAYFQEHVFNAGNLRISGGFMINWNSAYPRKPSVFPGLDLSYRLLPGTSVYFSFNRALHLPTFTDLFYTDPVNQGNIHLNPNRMISYEGGIKFGGHLADANMVFFLNTGKDIIDWLWSYGQNRYSPVNLEHFRSAGLETNVVLHFSNNSGRNPIRSLSINYIFMNLNKSVNDSVSKYDYIRNKLSMMVRHRIYGNIEAVWSISYQERTGRLIAFSTTENAYYSEPYKPYWLLDGTLDWHVKHFVVFAAITNILDTDYKDAGSVTQPGRWFKAGIRFTLPPLPSL